MIPDPEAVFSSVPWESFMPGIRHKAIVGSGRRLRLVQYTPQMDRHWCERGHWGLLLEGRFEIEFKDRTETYGPGDGLVLPPGPEHRHRAKALTDVVTVFFVEDLQ